MAFYHAFNCSGFAAALFLSVFLLGFSPSAAFCAETKAVSDPIVRQTPAWLDTGVMYQINLRAYTEEGTIAAAEKKLEDLARLGITIVYLCPFFTADDDPNRDWWTPRQKASKLNNAKNPYRMKDYYHIDPEYGTDADLKRYVEKAHSLGLKVLFDLVYLHCGPTAVFLKDHPYFVKRDAQGKIINSEWHFPEINFQNQELRRYLFDNMIYWIRDFDVDGFRCDAVTHTPLDFWEEARDELEKIKPGIVLLAEGEKKDYMKKAFDICYSYTLCNSAKFKNADLIAKRFAGLTQMPEKRYIQFLDQHDIANNDWDNRVEKRIGSDKINAFFVLGYMLPGTPMIYCGQEVCDKNRHSIFGHAPMDESGKIIGPPLVIDWKAGNSPEGRKRFELLSALGKIRKNYPGLFTGKTVWVKNSSPQNIISFLRKAPDLNVLTLVNISDHPVRFSVESDFLNIPLLQNGKIGKDQYELPAFGWLILKSQAVK
ncbi:MAG: alpha-amylase family glycosyl hydrolase [Planctomycetia bacterium]|nr:alpha-amylase family glycosyl hydrolase [Planctomycetia bacterium]